MQLEKCAQDLGSTSKAVGSSMAQLLTCAAQGNEHYTGSVFYTGWRGSSGHLIICFSFSFDISYIVEVRRCWKYKSITDSYFHFSAVGSPFFKWGSQWCEDKDNDESNIPNNEHFQALPHAVTQSAAYYWLIFTRFNISSTNGSTLLVNAIWCNFLLSQLYV